MSKTALLAAFLIAGFGTTAFAQTVVQPDKAALRAKEDSCKAEAKAKNLVDKAQRKAFMANCMK